MDSFDGVGAGIGIGVIIFYLILIVFFIIVRWKIFEKAGKPGWACIIPIYSTIVYLEIINKPIWWFFMFLIPLVNIYFLIVAIHRLSLSFGKDVGFTIGLLLLGIVFMPILAFSDAKYSKLPE